MSKYCSHSPACEEDVCRCDQYAEESQEEEGFRKLSKFESIVLCSFFGILLSVALYLSIFFGY